MAGLALTLVAVLLARHKLENIEAEFRRKEQPVEIVVAKMPIQAGTRFSEENLAKKSVPATAAGRRNVPAGEFELLLGAAAKIDIAQGEPILWSDVEEPFQVDGFSSTVPKGRRAVTLTADANAAFAGLLRPGDSVDLMCGDPGRGESAWIRNVPVIAVNRTFGAAPPEEQQEPETITLSVTPEEGRRIVSAAGRGTIHWFLRNPQEKEKAPRGRFAPAAGGKPPEVEIWKAGKRKARETAKHYAGEESL